MNDAVESAQSREHLVSDLQTAGRRAFAVGAAGAGLFLVGAFFQPEQVYRSYLLAYLFWIGVALGCLPIIMLHHQSGGAWGLVIRRLLEAGTRTLPAMAVLFLPLLPGLDDLYLWARPEAVAADEILQHKSAYLNVPFFVLRTLFYFAAWLGAAYLLTSWSREQDETGDAGLTRKMQLFSGPGIAVYALTMTFAAIDWVMSLEPHWYSTIFGLLWIVGQGLAALAFVIAVLAVLADRKPLADVIRPDIFHDLGKLLLAFVMVWAYFSFSQFLIIWAGNLPEEIPWYLHRSHGGWQWLGLFLIVFHFALPFTLLLSRDLKRRGRTLALVAIGVLLARFMDVFWVVSPNFHPEHLPVPWMDVLALVGLGGLWLWWYLKKLAERPLLPLRDPYLAEAFGS